MGFHGFTVWLGLAGLQVNNGVAAGAVLRRGGTLEAVHTTGEQRIQLANLTGGVEGHGHTHREGAFNTEVLPAGVTHVLTVVVAQTQNHALGALVEGVGFPGHALAVLFVGFILLAGGHAEGANALVEGGLELFEGAGRVLLGDGVHERAERAGQVGLRFGTGCRNQPVQRGVVNGFQSRGRERNSAAARLFGLFFAVVFACGVVCRAVRKEQLRARQRQQAPPFVGGGTGCLGVRQARQGAGGGVESVRGRLRGEGTLLRRISRLRAVLPAVLLRVFGTHRVQRLLDEGAAKLRHQGTQGRGAAHAGNRHVRGVANRVGGQHEVEELAGCLIVVTHGGEYEAGAGSGGGDGEHAQLVVAGVAHAFGVAADAGGRHRLLALPRLLFCLLGALAEARIAQVHKVAGAQQGAAHGGVGPGSFLQTAYIYSAPGLTCGERGGENLDRVLAYAAGGEGVHG